MDSGLHSNITAEEYHALDAPALSASIAKILINDSPLHAWAAHPKLNPQYEREEAKHLDLGTLCHALMLEGIDKAHVIQATRWEGTGKNRVDTGLPVEDYKTVAAREERDAARAAGKCPILSHEMPAIRTMMEACRLQLDAHEDASDAFTDGRPEQTLIWREDNGVICKARLDWLHLNGLRVDDYKTTSGSANPDTLAKNMISSGWHIQAAFYLRGLEAIYGRSERLFRFVAQENYSPFALSVITPSADMLRLGADQAQAAITIFGKCLASGKWPGYPAFTIAADIPRWEENKWQAQLAGMESL